MANGHDLLADSEATVIEDIKNLAGQIREHGPAVLERVSDHGSPFEQKSHTLMMESVDRITQQWVGELNAVRENTKTVETMVIQQAARVKSELTKLHLLGVQAMKEAQRGNEVSQHLAEELDTMMAEHAETH